MERIDPIYNQSDDEDSELFLDEISEQGSIIIHESLAGEGLELPLEEIYEILQNVIYKLADRLATAEKCIGEVGLNERYAELLKKGGLE